MNEEEKIKITERTERYIRGEMDTQEATLFEEDCMRDPALNEWYQLQLLSRLAIWEAGREDQKQALKDLYYKGPATRSSWFSRQLRWASIAAVIVILAIVTGVWVNDYRLRSISPESLFSTYYIPPRAPETMAVGDSLSPVFAAFRKGDFEKVAEEYDRIVGNDTLSFPEATFYLGIALLEQNQPKEAAEVLAKTSFVPEQTRWYLALAWLKSGNKPKALQELESIAAQPGHFYRNKAGQLRRQIR
ncbi:MAG: hypothetical protein R3C61_26145 [Bacteroidia bacterium]